MNIIRPVERRDLADLLRLAEKSGVGLTSLPRHEGVLAARIERAINTWGGQLPLSEQCYLFVLEDLHTQRVIGVSAIEVAVGLKEPWYSFRLGTQVHASKALNVYKQIPTLFLSNDHTGYSELCTLFLDPAYRHGHEGKLLSKARFLFIAAFRQQFGEKIMAEMRGVSDENGRSPFWEGIGRHFFSMEFAHADYLSGTGQKGFIAELMPKHPIYVEFLTAEAQQVVGEVHPQTLPARKLLEAEGLHYRGYVDIFDGGPTLEADIDQIRAVRQSQLIPAILDQQVGTDNRSPAPLSLLANDHYHHYVALLSTAPVDAEGIHLNSTTLAALGIAPGHPVRVLPLIA